MGKPTNLRIISTSYLLLNLSVNTDSRRQMQVFWLDMKNFRNESQTDGQTVNSFEEKR